MVLFHMSLVFKLPMYENTNSASKKAPTVAPVSNMAADLHPMRGIVTSTFNNFILNAKELLTELSAKRRITIRI